MYRVTASIEEIPITSEITEAVWLTIEVDATLANFVTTATAEELT